MDKDTYEGREQWRCQKWGDAGNRNKKNQIKSCPAQKHKHKKQNRNQCDWRQSRMTETQVPAEWLLSLHPVPCWMDEAGPAQQPHQECAVVQGTSARAGREATVVLRLRGSGRPAEGKNQRWSQFSSCCYITDRIGARRWNYNHTLLVVVLTQWSKWILFVLWKLHWTRAYRKRPSIKKAWIKGRPTMVLVFSSLRHWEGGSAETLAAGLWSQ